MENPGAGGRDASLFRATVAAAAKGGDQLMGRLVIALRQSLSARESATRELQARDRLIESRQLLDSSADALCAQYPGALRAAFAEAELTERATPVVMAELHFDDLELMDEDQVSESVETARSQQLAMAAADGALADLNRMVCAALGLQTVRPERNPLRPEVYVTALQAVLTHMQVPTATRQDWVRHMCTALGPELRTLYGELAAQLRGQGVVAAAYAVLSSPGGNAGQSGRSGTSARPAATRTDGPVNQGLQAGPSGVEKSRHSGPPGQLANANTGASNATPAQRPTERPAEAGAPPHEASLLTLNRLRRLLSGELDRPPAENPDESFADRFFREFDSPPRADADASAATSAIADFHPTVPAAFDALTEMGQVDQAMARIETRRALPDDERPSSVMPAEAMRRRMHRSARGMGQALSLEVVTMMVDNMAHDPRLLAPIVEVVKSLEPPLLQLALVDPRFFSDKQHPARRLLQEITDRSLAFDAVDAPGFAVFLHPLQQALKPLHGIQIESADLFEPVLHGLTDIWNKRAQHDRQQLESAMQALRQAEARNLVAETVSAEIRARPDAGLVAQEVLEFLSGPWAQVVGQARILNLAGAADPGGFVALIPVLVWSAQPGLTRKNLSELTRQVPRLVATLRQGLASIQYPDAKSEAFFETLMGLHQQALRPVAGASTAAGQVASQPEATGLQASLTDDADPWVAPLEAKASGFMEMPLDTARAGLPVEVALSGKAARAAIDTEALGNAPGDADAIAENSLPLGAWVELRVDSQWTRTQLTWASPQGTLFLFTTASGSTQSMTRRSRNKLFAAGRMRVMSSHPVLDGALDAVAQAALFNSMDNPDETRFNLTRFNEPRP